MAEINLPGISSDIDVKGIIDKLVKVENKKLDGFEKAKDLLNSEKSAWTNLGNKINDVQTAAHSLYGFRSPFDDKVAISDREELLTAKASRIANPLKSTVRIEQIAQNERILSDSVDSNHIFEPAALRISVGGNDVEIYFNGGRIENLADAINNQAGDYLTAKLTKATENVSVLILEAKETGRRNKITVIDNESLNFFKEIGLFKEEVVVKIDTELSSDRIAPIDEYSQFIVQDRVLTLEPENSVEYRLDEPVRAGPGMLLKIQVRAIDIPEEVKEEISVTWPALKNIGAVTVRDIEIQGGDHVAGIEVEEKVVEEKPAVIDNSVLGVKSELGVMSTVEADHLESEFREYTYRLTDIVREGEKINRVLFLNKNTGRKIEYKDLIIVDESIREGVTPKNLIQEARDSIVYIDGVKVQRGTNQIDDAIKGVILDLKRASEDEIFLLVDRDYEKITKNIVEMIEKYNELLGFINEQTRVIPSRSLAEDSEAGILAGDVTVMALKNKLQTIMMNPYPTDRGRELSLLAHVGISMGASNSNWSDIRGGYLQIDEERFIEAFEKYPDEIKQLFGSDVNRDMVIDDGLALVLDKTMRAYTEPRRGIVSYHIRSTDTKIKDQEEKIYDWNEHIEEYRKKLESDFTIMQQALNELEQNQKSLENFSNQFKSK